MIACMTGAFAIAAAFVTENFIRPKTSTRAEVFGMIVDEIQE